MSNISYAPRDVLLKVKRGQALNLGELAVALGYSFSVMQQWKRDGLPLVDGKIMKEEAWAWRKAYLAAPQGTKPPEDSLVALIPEVLRRKPAGKVG